MKEEEIEEEIERIEGEIKMKNFNLKEIGFWKIVKEVEKNENLKERFIERISKIDMRAFRKKVWVYFDVPTGNFFLIITFFLSFFWSLFGFIYDNPFLLFLGLYFSSFSIHKLSHYILAKIFGLRILFYFPGGRTRIFPNLKIELASYLRAENRRRAYIHFSGFLSSTLYLLIWFLLSLIALKKTMLIPLSLILVNFLYELTSEKSDLKRGIKYWREEI